MGWSQAEDVVGWGFEQVTRVRISRVNGQPEELEGFGGRRQPSLGWHEPDKSRGLRPVL